MSYSQTLPSLTEDFLSVCGILSSKFFFLKKIGFLVVVILVQYVVRNMLQLAL